MHPRQLLLPLACLFALAGCAVAPSAVQAPTCPAAPPCPPCPGVEAVQPERPLQPARWEEVTGWGEDDLTEAFGALLKSCDALAKQKPWQLVCEEARRMNNKQADNEALRRFFETRFTPWAAVNADGSREGLVTGYYEPLLKGSRSRGAPYVYPIYGVPDDLLVVDLSELYPDLKSFRLRGRLEGHKVIPYWSRAELMEREEQLEGKAFLWVADPIELFFLQVQGSGRVELPDGSRVRVGYADQNGHPYRSIGRWLVERGELPLDQASMQDIKAWAQAHPQRVSELLDTNPSFVFFRELPDSGAGPFGALGAPLSAGRSIAVDARSIPLGAPVFLATTWPASDKPLRRLVLAQDAGGAIRGVVRADFFWGFGSEAAAQAGRMRQKGQMWVLLPNGMVPKDTGSGNGTTPGMLNPPSRNRK